MTASTSSPKKTLKSKVLLILFLLLVLILLLPLLSAAAAIYIVYSLLLYAAVSAFWLPRGKNVLFVYSNSPHWKDYIEATILPAIQERAVVLNWSERSNWKARSLAVRCFHHFAGEREFNPMAVVFRHLGRAKVFRFWKPFRDYKHGHPGALEETQKAMFEYIRVIS